SIIFPTTSTGSFELRPNASTDQLPRRLPTFLAMRWKRRSLCLSSILRVWARRFGKELMRRNILSVNEDHGIDGRSGPWPFGRRHGHLHLLHRRTSALSSPPRTPFPRS